MLDTLRQGAGGPVAKVLMLLLCISFLIWGTGTFQGYHAGTLATVGDTEVSVQDFSRVYQNAQRNAQASGQQVQPQQVVDQLLMNAALDDAASGYDLGVSADRVAAEIAKNKVFQRADGTFDHDRFVALIANAGMNRDDFVEDVRRDLIRNQVAQSLAAGLTVPQPLVAALYRLQNEERALSYVIVDAKAIEAVGAPAEAALQAYFDQNKDTYKAPEYRKLDLVVLDPDTLADPAAITEDAVKAEYQVRLPNYSAPESRTIEQIAFPTADAATAAFATIEAGTDFAAAATAAGTTVTNLGAKTQPEIIDPAVGKAAFGAAANTPVLVATDAVQPSIIRVTAIQPARVTPLEEVAPQIRTDLATRAARDSVHDLYDKVEDERAGGSTLQEVATKLNLPYRVVETVDATGKAQDGSAADIPDSAAVVKAAFESDVGVENSAVGSDASVWVFFDVAETIPARDRTLDEVRERVAAEWTAAETKTRIAAKADELAKRLKGGETLAAVATEIGASVASVENVKRSDPPPAPLTGNAVNQAFAGPQGHVANAEGTGDARILLQVDRVTAPAYFAEAADAKAIQSQLADAMRTDMLSSYNRQVLDSRGSTVNQATLQQITGQTATP